MKCKLKQEQPKVFKPITLEITLETLAEAQELWHRLNITSKSIKSIYINNDVYESTPHTSALDFSDEATEVWEYLDEILEEYK